MVVVMVMEVAVMVMVVDVVVVASVARRMNTAAFDYFFRTTEFQTLTNFVSALQFHFFLQNPIAWIQRMNDHRPTEAHRIVTSLYFIN